MALILNYLQENLYQFYSVNGSIYKPLNSNLIDKMWRRKIKAKKNKFFLLPNKSVNEKYESKIKKIVGFLKKKKSDFLFVTASENNAWLLNIRGHDTKYAPIPYSYILIDKNNNIKFFCDLKKIPQFLRRYFKKIKFLDIKSCAKKLAQIKDKKFIIDRDTCSYFLKKLSLKITIYLIFTIQSIF